MDVEEKEETLIRNAYVYLTKKNYPEGCTSNEKRVIRKKSLKFQISENGELLYRHKLVGKVRIVLSRGNRCVMHIIYSRTSLVLWHVVAT